jgi:hypothetical protein
VLGNPNPLSLSPDPVVSTDDMDDAVVGLQWSARVRVRVKNWIRVRIRVTTRVKGPSKSNPYPNCDPGHNTKPP